MRVPESIWGELRIFSSPRAYMREGGERSEYFQVQEYMRGGRHVESRPLQALALPRRTAVSLQGELGAYMVETPRTGGRAHQHVFKSQSLGGSRGFGLRT